MKVESREYEILKTAFKTSHDVMSGGGGGRRGEEGGGRGRRVNVTMTFLNFSQTVWMCPLMGMVVNPREC